MKPSGTRSSKAAVLASAALFGLGVPAAKALVGRVDPVAMAGLLYFGSFLGLSIYRLLRPSEPLARLQRQDWPWLAGIVLSGGVAGPILLMTGLARTSGGAASLLLNLEATATALLAWLVFKENAGKRFWASLACMTAGGVVLTGGASGGPGGLLGSLLVCAAMAAWGVDNNLTRHLAERDPVAVARVKGGIAGAVNLGLALAMGNPRPAAGVVPAAFAVGAFAYGMSLVLFIVALRGLGSARTGALFGTAPFLGAAASVLCLREPLTPAMGAAALLMAAGAWLLLTERHDHAHDHPIMEHAHLHDHDDPHHGHPHEGGASGRHSHPHGHASLRHEHPHAPDLHHRHGH